jgi:hypothetical protein
MDKVTSYKTAATRHQDFHDSLQNRISDFKLNRRFS